MDKQKEPTDIYTYEMYKLLPPKEFVVDRMIFLVP